ncbi:ATP-binding protein [Antarcticimicrobium luteum]|uniref:histidine kinase n=1 Tax=Antarcticimicrobium luteum TaxID=2547397 RepID=A0A4R5UQI4_9RHOB|nr:ATP-binding protein [Antarcticimicrobium luteum]TDK41320.1 two-component sensor histidine kinase [Antarcticimicrobium luteum]
MRAPRSLQARVGLSLGLLLVVLWIAVASVTLLMLRDEMDEVFDAALMETAQRILPVAVLDVVGREEAGVTQRLGAIREHEEYFTYIVRDEADRILLQSHRADSSVFPAYDGPGFQETATHRFYSDAALQGSIRITVAEPLSHRARVARELQWALGLPILVVVPIALIAVVFALRLSLAPLRRFRDALAARHGRDLSPVPLRELPSEIVPVAETVNALLSRLNAAFEAERSFAANAAHELRTPLAGAIAQLQRLRAETGDAAVLQRAGDIEATLKRLTRLSERLMQLARAEGGRLRMNHPSDLRPVARVMAEDIGRGAGAGRIALTLPARPVLSDLDPDAFGILCRNLIENALRHGAPEGRVEVTLTGTGRFSVANDGPVVPPEILARLTGRFERAGAIGDGSGLGLAIVQAIAERSGSRLTLHSPRIGQSAGFEAIVHLPVQGDD